MNQIMESIFQGNTSGTVSFTDFLICTGVSLLLGIIIAAIHMVRNNHTRSFVITLALVPAIVQMVIMLVNGNVGTGIAVMGTFSLIRFRSAQGTAREIGSIFLAMAVGLAMGTGHIGLACLAALLLGGISLLLELLHFGETSRKEMRLRITIPESLDYTQAFDEVFEKYLSKWNLIQVKTTKLGSSYKLEYQIVLKDNKLEKEMLDDLRCRNGNLEILCSCRVMDTEGQVL